MERDDETFNLSWAFMLEELLLRMFDLTIADDSMFVYVRHIMAKSPIGKREMKEHPSDTWWNEFAVRAGLQNLRADGLVEYCRGLQDEDGQPAGSGYRITSAGEKRCRAILDMEEKA